MKDEAKSNEGGLEWGRGHAYPPLRATAELHAAKLHAFVAPVKDGTWQWWIDLDCGDGSAQIYDGQGHATEEAARKECEIIWFRVLKVERRSADEGFKFDAEYLEDLLEESGDTAHAGSPICPSPVRCYIPVQVAVAAIMKAATGQSEEETQRILDERNSPTFDGKESERTGGS